MNSIHDDFNFKEKATPEYVTKFYFITSKLSFMKKNNISKFTQGGGDYLVYYKLSTGFSKIITTLIFNFKFTAKKFECSSIMWF